MKFAIVTLLFVGLAVVLLADVSLSLPVETVKDGVLEPLELYGKTSGDGRLIRMRRAACDLFSWTSKWFTPNHAVCAAHCIALGNRGGECKGTVCKCRK